MMPGHMMYVHGPSLHKLKHDGAALIDGARGSDLGNNSHREDFGEIGRVAAVVLVNAPSTGWARLLDKMGPPVKVLIPGNLIVRESSSPG